MIHMEIKRIFIVVLDGAGVGALPDAAKYGDEGSNTLGHIALKTRDWHLPALLSLGLGKIVTQLDTNVEMRGAFGKMAALSPGKDTTSGHWELAGLLLEKPFPLYPRGFPPEIINLFEEMTGATVLGNISASGTEIIESLGGLHLQTGSPIVYTSADSVFQVAAHESVTKPELLYEWCKLARTRILVGEHAVGRVIARPFEGSPGKFVRTGGRRDYSLPPPGKTLLDYVQDKGFQVLVGGKVKDVFAGQGITRHIPASNNLEAIKALELAISEDFKGLFWTTLVDFDMIYGHRNDYVGFARAMESFDQSLQSIMGTLRKGDLLFITADHGCDPTFPGTDHTREYVPLLVYGRGVEAVDLGIRETFADLAATAAQLLGVLPPTAGRSFASQLFGRRVLGT